MYKHLFKTGRETWGSSETSRKSNRDSREAKYRARCSETITKAKSKGKETSK